MYASSLSPFFPLSVPTYLKSNTPPRILPNCRFKVASAEDEWVFPQPFSYIHMRAIFSCFTSPAAVFAKAYDALEPGGWLELQDVHFKPLSHDNKTANTAVEKWNAKLITGAKVIGRDWHCTPHFASWVREAGFIDVVEKVYAWPQNSWPKGEKQKALGRLILANLLKGLSGVSLGIMTRGLGMRKEEVEEELANVRRNLQDTKIHAYYPV
jgi:hypothetical protein